MNPTNEELVNRALAILVEYANPVIRARFEGYVDDDQPWTEVLRVNDLRRKKRVGRYSETDPQCVCRVLSEQIGPLGFPFSSNGSKVVANYALELKEFRNLVAHGEKLSVEDAVRALDTTGRLLGELGVDTATDELGRLKRQVLDAPVESTGESTAIAPATPKISITSVHASSDVSAARARSRIPTVTAIALENLGADDVEVVLDVYIESPMGRLTRECIVPIDMKGGESREFTDVEIALQLDVGVLMRVESQLAGHLVVSVKAMGQLVATHRQPIEVQQANQWWDRGDDASVQLLAAHVTPNAPATVDLVREATPILAAETEVGSWNPYDVITRAEVATSGEIEISRRRVDAMVRSIVFALQKREIAYKFPPPSWSDGGQAIRSVSDVVVDRAGTCLDTTVALASALESVRIRPVVLLFRGHALLGYWRDDLTLQQPLSNDPELVRALHNDGRIALVETTMVCSPAPLGADVSWEAISSNPWKNQFRPDGDNGGFEAMLDIEAARRDGVMPLTVREVESDGSVTMHEYHAPEAREVRAMELQERERKVGVVAAVPPRVRRWKNSLLDLSLRNRLLNFTKSSGISLAIPAPQLPRLEDIVNNGVGLGLRADDEFSRVEFERGARQAADLGQEAILRMLEEEKSLFAGTTTEAYARTMRNLAYKSRTSIQESGANNLYLTFGMLRWTPTGFGKPVSSPLVLVPVRLETYGRGQRYRLVLDETGESTPNYCLLEKLKVEFNLSIPELENPVTDASGIDLEHVFAATDAAIKAIDAGFHVEPVVYLANLEFSKFRMWKDLDEHWHELAENSLVNHLIHTPAEEFIDPAMQSVELTDVADLDLIIAGSPIESDASQAQAVADAVAGRTFVLEGPPGTGKSQTITNMLAHALVNGRKVLFVAEKAEALKVVMKRMESIGLGAFALDVHDKSSKASAVRAQLLAALDHAASIDHSAFERNAQVIETAQRSLARYASSLHEPNAAGISLYRAHNDVLALEDAKPSPVGFPEDLLVHGEERDFFELSSALRSLPEAVGSERLEPQHPWRFIDARVAKIAIDDATSAASAFDEAVHELQSLPHFESLAAAIVTSEDFRTVAELYRAPSMKVEHLDAVRSAEWAGMVQQVREATESFRMHPHTALGALVPSVIDADLAPMRELAEIARASGFFGRKKKRLAVVASLAPFVRDSSEIKPAMAVPLVDEIVAMHEHRLSLRASALGVPGVVLATTWNPLLDADNMTLLSQFTWLTWASGVLTNDSNQPLTAAAREYFGTTNTSDLQSAQAVTTASEAWSTFLSSSSAQPESVAAWLGNSGIIDRWRSTSRSRGSSEQLERTLRSWHRVLVALEPLSKHGLQQTRTAILDGAIHADDAIAMYHAGLVTDSAAERTRTTRLDEFDGVSHTRVVQRYQQGLVEARKLLPAELASRVVDSRTFRSTSTSGRVGALRRELERSRGGMSVRKLFESFGDVITSITPVIMMSPGSVARFFDAKPGQFDLVVFDEASQLRVADAIGSLGRARSAVVVGDSKQMPPTSVAMTVASSDSAEVADGEETFEDQESILSESTLARVRSHMLTWHYRSQDESLIAFSNKNFYRGRLSSFPTPLSGTRDDAPGGHGISLKRVDGEYRAAGQKRPTEAQVGIREGTQTNRKEADAVVAEILRRFDASPDIDPSIGVVTFNANQRRLIEDLLRDLRNERIIAALEDDEGIFVKNLESVQGDERDEIFFSVGRSADERGHIALNFGPLNQKGGERRLNVAVTRARRQIVMFCSFEPAQLKAENSASEGLALLKEYLLLAQSGATTVASTGSLRASSDLHRQEIALELRGRGYAVLEDVGLSDFRIDLSVARAGAAERPVAAILLDGPSWAERGAVADRDALPAAVLGGLMRWPIVSRVWLPEWIDNREAALDRLVAEIESAGTVAAAMPIVEPVAEPIVASAASMKSAPRHEPNPAAPVFREWKYKHHGFIDTLDDLPARGASSRVAAALTEIVEAEGPVHHDRLARLAASAFGLGKVNAKRAQSILRCLPLSLRGPGDEPFAWPATIDAQAWRVFRIASYNDARPIEHVSWREIVNAMDHLCAEAMGMSETEVTRLALAEFGGKRMTAGITAVLNAALARGVQSGRLVRSGGLIQSAGA